MTVGPFGQLPFGEREFGDGAGSTFQRSSSALALSYTVVGYSSACSISYTLQVPTVSTLPIMYWVVASIADFSINGQLVRRPNNMQYHLPASIGPDISGIPIIQGYGGVSWEYDVLLDADIALLMALYDPLNPQVTITYPNEDGMWVQKVAMMQPPNLGTRSTVIHQSVILTFTHIATD